MLKKTVITISRMSCIYLDKIYICMYVCMCLFRLVNCTTTTTTTTTSIENQTTTTTTTTTTTMTSKQRDATKVR